MEQVAEQVVGKVAQQVAQPGVEQTILPFLRAILKDIPPGAWVAISEARHAVMAYGDDGLAVMEESHRKGEDHPLMMRAPNGTMHL